MKKVRLKEDLYIMYFGKVKAGTEFKVDRFNNRFVYVKYLGCVLRLSRKEVEVIY